MIQIKNIDFSYDDQPFFKGLNISFKKGKTALLIGPSGCGKSSILRLLCGLNQPQAGKILFNDLQLSAETLMTIRLNIGYVIQDGGLFPHMTALDNIRLMARRQNWADTKIQQRVTELCKLTQFPKDGLSRKPAFLSGGQRQRVSLMRALMLDPELLLLDEPLGALDPMIRSGLQKNLKEIFKKLSKTVVMVSHDLNEAAFLADTIILMNEAKIEQQDTIRALMKTPHSPFVRRFIESQRSYLPEDKNA